MSAATAEATEAQDDGETETTQETRLDAWVQQALVASNMVRAARLIAEGLDVGDGAEELALTEVLRQAEEAVGVLFASIAEAQGVAEVAEQPAAA